MTLPKADHFHSAVTYVLRNEGGFTCEVKGESVLCDERDRGGPTKYGISLRTLSEYRGSAQTPNDMKELGTLEAIEIYRVFYWKWLWCDKMQNGEIATAVLDLGVLFGPYYSAYHAQLALRSTGFPRMVTDGIIGPITLKALDNANFPTWCVNFQKPFYDRIKAIVQNDQSQAVHRNGWENRVAKLRSLV